MNRLMLCKNMVPNSLYHPPDANPQWSTLHVNHYHPSHRTRASPRATCSCNADHFHSDKIDELYSENTVAVFTFHVVIPCDILVMACGSSSSKLDSFRLHNSRSDGTFTARGSEVCFLFGSWKYITLVSKFMCDRWEGTNKHHRIEYIGLFRKGWMHTS